MKKEYFVPEIIFDSFTLNENIAATCSRNVTGQYSGNCGLQFGNKRIFTADSAGCVFKVEDGSPMFDSLCYHVPTEGNKLFNS